jgi:hypothetical protein
LKLLALTVFLENYQFVETLNKYSYRDRALEFVEEDFEAQH